jgi:RimJ/RimL family protein N-acetyltransferase
MIKGKKVGLRAIERTDLEQLRDWRNNEEFRKNFREHKELSLANQENWYSRVISSANDYMFIIERLSDHEPLGACGLLYVNWINRSADFSFYIGYQGVYIDNEGLAEDAAKLLIDYGFNNLNLNKIWMELYEFDTLKLTFFIDRFKFQRDGVLRENCFEGGKYFDSYIISLLRRDYL